MASSSTSTDAQSQSSENGAALHPPTDEKRDLERNSASIYRDTRDFNDATDPATTDSEKQICVVQDADSNDDENIVWWDGDDDPHNPYNWPAWRKVLNSVLVSSLSFITPLASSMFAPGVPDLMQEFHTTSQELAAFCVSVYVLGFAAGPMLFAPLSELYGRSIIYNITNVGFIGKISAYQNSSHSPKEMDACPLPYCKYGTADTRQVFVIACAKAPSMNALIVFRFFSGIFGSCPITNGGGTITDMITQEKRGAAMAGFAIGPLLGPVVGPVIGGFITTGLGWRWVFWIMAILAGTLALLFAVFARETAAYLKRGIMRPFKLLRQDHQKKAAEEAVAAEAEGRAPEGMKPEYRLSPLMVGALVLPMGFFIYGWTAEYQVHWIAPIIGTVVIGVGDLIVYMSLQMYLVDTFTIYAASALAANAVIRSIAGSVLPLAGLPMYNRLGMGWGNSILGFIGLALSPVAWLFLKHGENLRKRFDIKNL
ncbi:hypothetical protein TrVFT333_003473 [Trichoderma virens FT-333]|nr:hypothetical protein TrVFT333_003473 [Trichoderma virens FT-333]